MANVQKKYHMTFPDLQPSMILVANQDHGFLNWRPITENGTQYRFSPCFSIITRMHGFFSTLRNSSVCVHLQDSDVHADHIYIKPQQQTELMQLSALAQDVSEYLNAAGGPDEYDNLWSLLYAYLSSGSSIGKHCHLADSRDLLLQGITAREIIASMTSLLRHKFSSTPPELSCD